MSDTPQTTEEEDEVHECTIRNRRNLAPGDWSNSDIDCLLRNLDRERASASMWQVRAAQAKKEWS